LAEKERQTYLCGTSKWYRSKASRASVEGTNGNLKSNLASMRPGDLRMMGRDEHQLFAAMAAIAHNILLTRRFRYNPRAGRPRMAYAGAASREAAPRQAAHQLTA